MLDHLVQRQALRLRAQALDQRAERRGLRAGGGSKERAARLLGSVLQQFHGARADAARREVRHPQERIVIVGQCDEAQIRERMLDLRTLEEAQAAVHAIGKAAREKRVLEHARLRVRAVEHRHLR